MRDSDPMWLRCVVFAVCMAFIALSATVSVALYIKNQRIIERIEKREAERKEKLR